MPEAGAHLWDWFWELSKRRRSGPEPLTFGEIGEWGRLTGTAVRPEEVSILLRMDDAFIAQAREEQNDAAVRASEKHGKSG